MFCLMPTPRHGADGEWYCFVFSEAHRVQPSLKGGGGQGGEEGGLYRSEQSLEGRYSKAPTPSQLPRWLTWALWAAMETWCSLKGL